MRITLQASNLRQRRSKVNTTSSGTWTTQYISLIDTLPAFTSHSSSISRQSRVVDFENIGHFLLPLVVTTIDIFVAPYTKVEETPALHAVYDFLVGSSPATFDNIVYPGAVARSLIPALALSVVAYPFAFLSKFLGDIRTPLDVQILVRVCLAAMYSLSHWYLANTITMLYGLRNAWWFTLLGVTQFHIPYYAGRTLPNFLALPLVMFAFGGVLRGKMTWPFALLSFTTTMIRLELAPLVLAFALLSIAFDNSRARNVVLYGFIGGVIALAMTATIDQFYLSTLRGNPGFAYTWWPELSSAVFNIVQGKSSEWGTSPAWSYLPAVVKLLMASGPLALFAPRDRVTAMLVAPAAAMVATLSLVGHKEWRFVVYVVPLLNILAARVACQLWTWTVRTRLVRLCLITLLLLQASATTFMTMVSRYNYPCGQVIIQSEHLVSLNETVWLPAAALHSGVTLFTLPNTIEGSDTSLHRAMFSAIPEYKGHGSYLRPESAHSACSTPWASPEWLRSENVKWAVTDDWVTFQADGWKLAAEVDGFKGVKLMKEWPYVHLQFGTKLAVMSS